MYLKTFLYCCQDFFDSMHSPFYEEPDYYDYNDLYIKYEDDIESNFIKENNIKYNSYIYYLFIADKNP